MVNATPGVHPFLMTANILPQGPFAPFKTTFFNPSSCLWGKNTIASPFRPTQLLPTFFAVRPIVEGPVKKYPSAKSVGFFSDILYTYIEPSKIPRQFAFKIKAILAFADFVYKKCNGKSDF